MTQLNLALASPVVCAVLLFCIRAPFYTHAQILRAIWLVESSGRLENVPAGDGGRSIGPLQISMNYWVDSRVEGHYQDCLHVDYARKVVAAYMQRWVGEAWLRRDAEVIARVHNGGPKGMRKQATLGYWQRVQKHLQDLD